MNDADIQIDEDCINSVLRFSLEFVKKEPNVLQVNGPVYVIGDLHGNFDEMMKLDKYFGLLNPGIFKNN